MPDLDNLARDPEHSAKRREYDAPDRLHSQPDWPDNWVVLELGNSRPVDQVNTDAVRAAIDQARDADRMEARDWNTWGTRGTYGYTAFAFRVRTADGADYTGAFELFGELHDGMHTEGVASLDDDKLGLYRCLIQLAAICDAWPGIGDRPDDGKVWPEVDDDELPPEDHWTRRVLDWLSQHDLLAVELEETQEGDICHVTEAQVYKACVELDVLAGDKRRPSHSSIGCYPLYYVDKAGETYCGPCAAKLPLHGIGQGVHEEGAPITCDECGAEIESNAGEPGVTYIIRKRPRTGTSPYAGPSCANAGVTPGRVYDHESEAREDCDKLNKHGSPVGFDVVRLEDGKEVGDG